MKANYIRDLDKNTHSLDGLLESIDLKEIKSVKTGNEIGHLCYAKWKNSEIGISFSSIVDYLMTNYFDSKIIERCDYIRECWQNCIPESFKKSLFIYSLESNYYKKCAVDILEKYTNSSGYEVYRFKESVNPKELNILHHDFLVYMAITNIKYGDFLKSYRANIHLGFAKQINSKTVNQLKKYGTGDLDKNLIEFKTNTISCLANDIYATINITLKEETEENYKQALAFLIKLIESGKFLTSYQLKYSGKQKNVLPLKGMPKKPPHYFFANAIQFKTLHEQIYKYGKLVIKEDAWYENVPDENPAMTGTFAVFALGLENEKYIDLVLEYFKKIDYEHQYLQENYVPALIEKYGLTEKTHAIAVLAITGADNFKQSKILSAAYNTPEGIDLLKNTKLETNERAHLYNCLFKNKIPNKLTN